jgi:predicted MFS family arabinose efflux permease
VAGITATLSGGYIGDLLRKRLPGAYFIVSACGIWISCPLVLLILWTPFPWAWVVMFFAMFFLFFNTGPSNAILANVTHPSVRATAFAFNIFIIHTLGDAISPSLLGTMIGGGEGTTRGWTMAFSTVSAVMVVAGFLWLQGARYLERDTELAPRRLDGEQAG